MQSCLEISMGSLPALCTQNSSLIIPYIILFWQQNKPLLSVLLANHALLETYLQDEDSQMDTQLKLEESLVNARPEVWRMKLI